jgi:hypothetical protein
MAVEIKRPLVSDLFAIGSSVGANGNNAVAPAIVSGSYQPTQGDPNARAQQPQGGGMMDALTNVGGKVAGRALNNYVGGAGAAGAGASTGSGVGYGLGQSLVSGGIGGATYAGTAGAAGFGAGAGSAATGVGYGLGGALSSGTIGGATYAGAGGAIAGGTAAGAGAAGAGAGAGAAGGAAAGGAASGAAAAGPFAAIAAAIIMNEQDSQARGLRREGNDYYKDLATGKVLQQDINGKWAPMTDSIFGEKSGLGNDQRFFGDVMTLDFKSAAKNFKKSSLMTGFGLWG